MSEPVPMTQAGYDKLKAELDQLETVELPKAAQRVADARAQGDLKENAEYHGARESHGMLQAKVNLLRDKLGRARVIDLSKVDQERVAMGATIRVRNLDTDDEDQFTLVGAGEDDFDEGKILVTSPLAQGFVGAKQGEKVEIQVPAGLRRFDILEVRYDIE